MDEFNEALGDAQAQGAEEIVSDWIDSNREILRQAKLFLSHNNYLKLHEIIKNAGPI